VSRFLLGVSGGIAAYKALELVRLAVRAGHAVRVIQTPASERFVGRASFQALTGAPVLTSEFDEDPARGAYPGDPVPTHDPIGHLALVANADVYVLAPATANTIARLAHGLADTLPATAALAATCPLVVAPAMNNHMWEHPATQANVQTLRARGVTIVEPGVGELASKGEYGPGRLAEPAEILAAAEAAIARAGGRPGPLDGLRVLVTAGGTREPIDSVRFIGNRSSGRMGFALAEEAADLGAAVTVIAANVELPRDPRIDYVDVQTAQELHDAAVARFPEADVLLMAAAVVDFRPALAADHKIKKVMGQETMRVELELTPDILSELAAARTPGQTVVGFAAEHGERALDYGREKLARKGLDAIVVNDISRRDIGFDVDHNEVTVISAARERRVPRAPKREIARAILEEVMALRGERMPAPTADAP
jgi:phosphopantothenoylcysteine decarboxylase/phosphopantothenate--cysteine ligase